MPPGGEGRVLVDTWMLGLGNVFAQQYTSTKTRCHLGTGPV